MCIKLGELSVFSCAVLFCACVRVCVCVCVCVHLWVRTCIHVCECKVMCLSASSVASRLCIVVQF